MTTLAQNKKARHNFHILETFEAGIALVGTEVKSCRARSIALTDSYARLVDGELFLIGAHIAEYTQGNRNNHAPRRSRKLLMHKREIRRLTQDIEARGLTLIPLRVYLLRHNIKVELGLCKGKNVRDKREDIKKRMYDREARRALEQHRG